MINLVGKTLGKYRILARLGRGGTATVYKAYQPGLDRHVAIKVLHGHLAEDEDFIRRFEREASAVARLRHPNIVQVHDFDHIGDLYYMVMEFIEGPSLKEELRARNSSSQAFTLSEIARVFGALGGAIDYAHEQGMVHHDLKPANIMFTAQGQAVLTDFGIAKIVGHSAGTLTGAVFGTPTYMSPEQGQGQRGDERSDIYSLGLILFEVVTGQVPFDDDTPYTIINRHISDPLPSPSSLNPDLPPEMERAILKATEKSPDARFQSGCSLALALYEAVGLSPGQSLVSAPVVPLAQVAEPPTMDLDSEFPLYTPSSGLETPSSTKIDDQEPPTRLRRRPYVTAVAIVLLLLIGLVGVYGIFGDGIFTFLPATLTPTPQPSVATPTPLGNLVAANTPISSPTATATNTPTVTATPAPTSTATPTPSPPPTATETLTPAPTAVPPSPTPTRIGPEDLYNRILFKTDRAGTVQIYSMNPDGSDQQLVDPLIYNQLAALEALSPDGKQQVVVRTEGNAELWLITLDGSQDEWRITYTAEYDYDPAWSPAGELIAFVSERTGNGDIYISTPLGFAAERITFNEDAYDRHPSWSPDGQYLVFWSNAHFGLRQLYIYDIQTGETRSVGGGPYNDWDPLWVK